MRFSSHLVLVFVLLRLGNAWAGADEPPMEVAKNHYAHGLDRAQQGDYQGALQDFREAYAASPHYAVRYNIGQALIALDRPLEAAAELSRYLQEGQDQIGSERRRQVEDQITLLEALLGELDVTTEPAGALITVDGRAIGRTPIEESIRLAAGIHQISASLDGGRPVERQVVIGQGKRHEVVLQLPLVTKIEQAKDAVAVRIEPPPQSTADRSRLRVASPYALVGTGVALAGAAVFAFLWERRAYDKWQAAQPALNNAEKFSPDYGRAATESNRLAGSVTAAKYTMLGLAIASGVLVTTGASLYLRDRRPAGSYSTPTVAWNGGASFTAGWSCSW